MKKEKILKNWKIWVGILIVLFVVLIAVIVNNSTKEANVDVKLFKLGEIINLRDTDKQLLRETTEKYVKEHLKAPSTAQFENDFEYICDEENIVKVKGYVDSQNSFGTMLRGQFLCEYFVVDSIIDTLVYLKYNDTELLNIKETYIKLYKEQKKLDEIKESGNDLNQEKLEYIKEEFNNQEWNDVGRIEKVKYDEKETQIDVKIVAKSSMESEQQKKYWTNYNICSVLDYFNEFNIIGKVKMQIYDIDNNKIVELIFDNDFMKNIWNNNHQINLVENLFGQNYKEFF